MIDTRFHRCIGPLTLADLCIRADHKNLVQSGFEAVSIAGASDLVGADRTSVSFAASASYAERLEKSDAAAIFLTAALAASVPDSAMAIVCDDPYAVFVDTLNVLYPDDTKAVVASAAADGIAARCEDGVVLGQGVVLGPAAEVGWGTVIGPNAVIGAGVTIGRNCVIGAGVIIECAHVGNGVILQAGVVVGSEGFGFQLGKDGHKKIPQLGRVIIQDRAEIGANTTIDRGTLGDTVIGEGSKIDNLVQIGHNCRIGRNCVISGMCGLSGSTVLEDGVVMGGGAGTAGHLTIGAGSVVLARSGVTHDVPPGSNIAGAPAQDVRMWKREIGAVRRLAKGGGK